MNLSTLYQQSRMISHVRVQTLCERQKNRGITIIKAKADDSVRKTSQLMEKHKVGAVMVEDANECIVGILTARDVSSAVALHGDYKNLKAQLIDFFLSSPSIAIQK